MEQCSITNGKIAYEVHINSTCQSRIKCQSPPISTWILSSIIYPVLANRIGLLLQWRFLTRNPGCCGPSHRTHRSAADVNENVPQVPSVECLSMLGRRMARLTKRKEKTLQQHLVSNPFSNASNLPMKSPKRPLGNTRSLSTFDTADIVSCLLLLLSPLFGAWMIAWYRNTSIYYLTAFFLH